MSETQPPKTGIILGAQKPAAGRMEEPPVVYSVPFPDKRTHLWIPNSARGERPPEIALVVAQEVMQRVNHHVGQSLDHEIGGFLLGNRYRCPNSGTEYVVIDQCTPAHFTEETSVSLSFTKEAWAKLADELSGKFRGKLLAGWYHSHPKMDIFLSKWDAEIHEQRFKDSWMSALVIEPEKTLGGFFCRRNGVLGTKIPVEFFEYLEGAAVSTRHTCMVWEGYKCADPVSRVEVRPTHMQPNAWTPPPELTPAPPPPAPEPPPPPAPAVEPVLQPQAISFPFPTGRCRQWIPDEANGISPVSPALVVAQELLLEIQGRVMATPDVPVGGFLLGNLCSCPNGGLKFIMLDQHASAELSTTDGSLVISAEAWSWLEDDLKWKYRGKMLVGWYRSNPQQGLGFSERYAATHSTTFPQEWMSLLVVDPKLPRGVIFRGSDCIPGNGIPADFYEYLGDPNQPNRSPGLHWGGYTRIEPPKIEAPPKEVVPKAETRMLPRAPEAAAKPAQPLPFSTPRTAARPTRLRIPTLPGRAVMLPVSAVIAALMLGALGMKFWTAATSNGKPIAGIVRIDVDRVRLLDVTSPQKGLELDLSIRGLPPNQRDILVKVEGQRVSTKPLPTLDASTVRLDTTASSPDVGKLLQALQEPTAAKNLTIQIADPKKPDLPIQTTLYVLNSTVLSAAASPAAPAPPQAVLPPPDPAALSAIVGEATKTAKEISACANSRKSGLDCEKASHDRVLSIQKDLVKYHQPFNVIQFVEQASSARTDKAAKDSLRRIASELNEIAKKLSAR
jgi:proteasome lid subunit RPN8/RPN11